MPGRCDGRSRRPGQSPRNQRTAFPAGWRRRSGCRPTAEAVACRARLDAGRRERKRLPRGVRFCLLLPAILVYRYTGVLVKRGGAVFLNKFRGGFLSILNRRRENGRISGRQTWAEGACAAAWPRSEICSLSKGKTLRTGNASFRPREMVLPEKRRGGVAPRRFRISGLCRFPLLCFAAGCHTFGFKIAASLRSSQ